MIFFLKFSNNNLFKTDLNLDLKQFSYSLK